MSELLRVLADEDVDDDALQEAAAAAFAVLETRDIEFEGVAPVLREDARDAGQRPIDDALANGPDLELILSPVHGDSRRLQITPNPDSGAPFVLTEAEWTGCAWSHNGTEGLDRVEIDGEEWHEADAADSVEPEAGP